MTDHDDRVDPDKWRPLIMSFQKFYGLASGQIHESKLSNIPEAAYRGPVTARATAAQPAPPKKD